MGLLDGLFGSNDTTVKNKLPGWYTDQAKANIDFANNAGSWYAMPYMGNTVAGFSDLQNNVLNQLGGQIGSTNAGFNNALAGTQQGMNYQPQQVGAQYYGNDIAGYMNPFVENVEQPALARLNDQRLQSLNQIGDQANRVGAFGGSRHGVAEGVTNAEAARSAGELSANLRNNAYNQAMGMAQQAGIANQQAGLQGANLNLGAANQYGQLTAAQQQAYLQSLQSALQGGNMQQQQSQNLLDQTANQYNAIRQYPLDLFNLRNSAINGLQLPTAQSTTGGGGLASGIMGGLGGALTGASLFGTGGALAGLGGITSGGGALGGALLGLLGGLSDEDEKTNIEKLADDPETGLGIYAYDYKSDVKAAKKNKTPMPMKRVGPMAQEIEAKFPGSTMRVGGKLVVTNLGFGG